MKIFHIRVWLFLIPFIATPLSAATNPSGLPTTFLLSSSEVEALVTTRTDRDNNIFSGAHFNGAPQGSIGNSKWRDLPAGMYWTDLALEMIAKYQQNPLRAARTLSYLHTAIYDAIVVAQQSKLSTAGERVAAHMAGGGVLELFYPQETEGRFMALAAEASAATTDAMTRDTAHAWDIARAVVTAARARAAADGADAIWKVADRPKPRPGLWQAAPPLYGYRPLEPLAGQWRPWLLKQAGDVPVPPPVLYGSEAYWAEAKQVLDTYERLTPAQKKIADDWNLGLGTVTPAGVWNLKAKEIALQENLSTRQTAELFALLNATMLDAFLACWDVKFRYWTERPVTAIRSRFKPEFLPHLVTPTFPSYVSGHSSVSGAAAEILSAFFPSRRANFNAMAEEAALSRLYGGIHFESDNNEGLALGHKVGQKAIERWPISRTKANVSLHQRAEHRPLHPTLPDTAVVH